MILGHVTEKGGKPAHVSMRKYGAETGVLPKSEYVFSKIIHELKGTFPENI
jgi:hypothetical protein